MESVRHSRLRYVDAGDIEDARVDFDGLDVYNLAGNKLGDVDGFIVDRDSNRPYYIVVDSGGWFSSRRYLVPIGHARLDTDNDRLRLDIERKAIEQFPAFEPERFEAMPEDEAKRFNEQLLMACCPGELKGRHVEGRWDYDAWSHYRVPDWWLSRPIGSATASSGTTDRLSSTETHSIPPPPSAPGTYDPRREEILGRRAERDFEQAPDESEPVGTERAKPGDVLGIDRSGKTTSLGDTAREEGKKQRDVEEDIHDENRKNRDR